MEQTRGKRTAKALLAVVLAAVSLLTIVQSVTGSASATDSEVTWNGMWISESFRTRENVFVNEDSDSRIQVRYSGGKQNMLSGMYSVDTTMHILFNDGSSELAFTSTSGNAFITKIVIKYDKVGDNAELGDIDVNHNKWTREDVTDSDGKHTLTMTGPAARTVTLRNHYNSYYWHPSGVTSIQIYLTPNLYTTNEDFFIKDLEDGGVKIVSGNPSYPRVGVPFLVRINGKIAGFSQDDSDDTQSYTIENPLTPFQFETIVDKTITVTNAGDFLTSIASSRINKVILGADIALDSGFAFSRTVNIDLDWHTLSCDSKAADKNIRVSGGDSFSVSFGNGTVDGFDNIIVGGHASFAISSGTYRLLGGIAASTSPLDGTVTLSGGEFHLPLGVSGWVVATGGTYYMPNGCGGYELPGYIKDYYKLQGGRYKLYDTFDMDTLRSVCRNGYAPFADGEGWAAVRSHYHDYYKRFYNQSDGGVRYLHRCDGCDHTVSDWTLTGEEINTLIELNGGAFTDVWQWDREHPETATLRLTISDETYNAAIAAPYNMNAKALADIRDGGIVGEPGTPGETEHLDTFAQTDNNNSGDRTLYFNGTNVTLTHGDSVKTYGFLMTSDSPPATLTAKNGKKFYSVVFHVGAYKEGSGHLVIDHDRVSIYDDGETIALNDLDTDTVTLLFDFPGGAVAIKSVDVVYADDGSHGTSIALRTERNGTDCYGRKASFTYRGHTYSKTFENAAVASHNYQYDFDWKFGEERQIPYNDPRINWTRNYTVNEVHITGAHRTCTDCGHKEDPTESFMNGRIDIVSPSYTANGTIRFPVTLRFADGSTHFDAYEYVIPMFPLVHYPAVPATCESWGNVEFWFDAETNQVYADAEGKQCITETNDPEHAPGAGIAPFKHLYDPKTDITWTWTLADSTIFLNGNDDNPIKSFEPHVTASFACQRCGETVTVNEQRVSFDYVSGDGPTFESDGHLVLKGRVNLREYAYDGEVTDPETGVVIEGPETEVVIPKLERVYTKVEAKEPTFTEAGNIEYYACNDGKGYAKNDDGTYTELPSGSWIIPSHGFEEIRINDYKSDFEGTMADVSCQGGTKDGAWIENEDGTPTSMLTVTAKSGFQISKVVYHISYGEDRTDCARIDKGQLSVSDDGRTITVTGINSKSVTLSTVLSEDDIIPQEPDPDDPDWERIPDSTSFMVNSVEVFCGETDETVYTMVPAKEATFTEAGNLAYYTGSDGKYYTRDGETYTEIAEGAWVIPAITLTKVEAKEPTTNEAGNSEYYAGSNGKYYVKDGDSYGEIRKYSWITFEEGGSWTHVEFVPNQYEYTNGQFSILVSDPNEFGAAVAEMKKLTIQPGRNNRLVSVTLYVSSNSENASTVLPEPGNVTVETNGDIIRVRNINFPSLILKSEKPIRISSLDICLEGSGDVPSEPDRVEFEPGGSNFHGSQVDVQTDKPSGEYGVLVDTQNAVRVFAREGKTLDRVVFFVRSGFENTQYASASSGRVRVEGVERIEVTDIGKGTLTLTGDGEFYVGAVDVYYASGSGESGGSVIDKCTYRFERAEIYCNRPLIFTPNEAALTNGSVYITYDDEYGEEYGKLDLTDAAAYAYRFYDQTGHEITLNLLFVGNPEGREMGLSDDMNLTARSYELGMDSLPLYIVVPENDGGESGGITVGSFTRDMVDRMDFVTDLPNDFVQVDLETAKTWTGAPNEGRAHLIFASEDGSVRVAVFDNGKFLTEEHFSGLRDIDSRLRSGEPVFYVTGRGSGQPAQTTYTRVPYTEPTPNKEGNFMYYIGSDGKYYEKDGDDYYERPLDFFMIPKVSVRRHAAVAATPNKEGNVEYYTDNYGRYYVKNGNEYTETTLEAVTIAKLTLVHHAAVTASCTENGTIEYWYDEANGKYFSDANGEHEILLADTVVSAHGHSFGEWVVTKPAQVGVKGEETRTCSVCGETETRETAALPDTPDTPEHEHKFTYTLSESKDTIIAVCENEGCTLTENLTVSVATPALTVYGGAESANATVTGGIDGIETPTVEYYQGSMKLTAAPTDAGSYTASITVDGVTASVSYTITKAAGSISYATASISKAYGDAAFTNELTKTGDGTVSYASSNTAVATVDANGEVTVVGVGTANITATVADGSNYAYAAKAASYALTVNAATMTVSAAGYTGTYDGNPHSITVTVTTPATGATITYGTTEGTYDLSANPAITNVSDSKTVYFKVTAPNYADYTGSAAVTINKANQDTPDAPTAASTSTNSITLTAITNGEYSKDGTNWQTSPTFTGLTMNTQYTFYQRLKEDGNHNASPASASASISTNNHTHEWSYAADGATITATCADTDGSHGEEKTATLTIAAPASLTYDGKAKAATLNGSIDGVATPTVEYYQGSTKLTAAPTNAGSYTASITLGGVTASVSYTIAKAAPTVTAPTAKTLTYTGIDQDLAEAGATDGGTMQYCVGTSGETAPVIGYSTKVPQGTDAKTYYVWYRVIGDSNYNDSEAVCLTVTIGKAEQSAPSAPTASSASATSVTLTAIDHGEYSMNGADWQTSPTFTGLTQTSEYTFYQRLAADDNHNASVASASATIPTTAHVHSWRYTVSGATITATCADTDGSHGAAKTATMTLVAPTLNIYGGTGSAEATVIGGIDGVVTPTVEYYQGSTRLTAAPTNAGSYTARITLGGVTASVSYTIAKATPVVTAPKLIDNLVANGSDLALIMAGATTGGTMQYKLGADGTYSTAIPTATEAGSYTVYYRVVGGENYDDAAEKSFAVPVAAVAVAVEPVQEAAKEVTPVTAASGAIDESMTGTLSTVASSSKIDGIEDQAADAAKAAAAAELDSNKRSELGYAPNEEVKLEATVKVAVQVKSALSENNSAATTGSAVASLKLDITPTVSVVAKSKDGSSDLPLVTDEPMKELTEEVEVVVNLSGLGFTPKLARIDHEGAISYETVVDKGNDIFAWSQRQFSEVTLLADERYGDITFLTKDGATIASKSFGAGELNQAFGVTAPAVSGYTFEGWTLNSDKLSDATLTDDLLTTLNNASHKLVLTATYQTSGGNGGNGGGNGNNSANNTPATNPEQTQSNTDTITSFVDVNASAWYADAVRWALNNGVMNGVGGNQFNPNGETSRAMIVTMLWRLENSPAVNYAMSFSDVESDTWYTEAVRWANAEGVVEGDGGKFNPNGAVTREQLATMLYRYAQYKKADVSASADLGNFNDAASVSGWATSAMQWAVGSGIINGIGNDLVPAGNATRAQVATMLMRYSTAK